MLYLFDIISVILSAVLLVMIFPGFSVHFLAWIALVPLFLVIRRSQPARAFLYALITGSLFGICLVSWLLRFQGINPLNFSLLVLATGAIYFGLFGCLTSYLNKWMPRCSILIFPSIWVVLEYLRSHMGFLALPWGILGYSQYSVLPVAKISAFTGVYGVSFLIVAVNAALCEITLHYVSKSAEKVFPKCVQVASKVPYVTLTVTVVILSISYITGSLSFTDRGNYQELKVALVQGGKKPTGENYARNLEKAFRQYQRLSLAAAKSRPELIVWPESSVPGKMPYDFGLVRMISNLAKNTGSFLLVGTSGYDKYDRAMRKRKKVANSAFLFSPRGNISGSYNKMLLLPFLEYLPLRGYVKWPEWIVSSEMTDYQAGDKLTTFDIGEKKFGVAICWENMMPGHFRKLAAGDVDFMVSMMNESFTDVPAAHNQIFSINVFRAIENNVPILRVALGGVAAIIEPTGKVTARLRDSGGNDVGPEGYIVGEIPLSSKRTVYNRFGDWFIYLLLFILTCLVFWKCFLGVVRSRKVNEEELFKGGLFEDLRW